VKTQFDVEDGSWRWVRARPAAREGSAPARGGRRLEFEQTRRIAGPGVLHRRDEEETWRFVELGRGSFISPRGKAYSAAGRWDSTTATDTDAEVDCVLGVGDRR
jgi:hypothetical protein